MRLRYGILIGVALLNLAGYQSVQAQKFNPTKVPAAITPLIKYARELGDPEKATLKSFIGPQIQRIMTAKSGAEIQDAKSLLLNPINHPLVGLYFYQAYIEITLNEISGVDLARASDMVKVNVLIMLAELKTPLSLGLASKSLDDPNIAVRYWAAKTISMMVRKGEDLSQKLGNHEQEDTLKKLSEVVAKEKSAYGRLALYEAFNVLTISEARLGLLDALKNAAGYYVKDNGGNIEPNINTGIEAELAAIKMVQQKMLIQYAEGKVEPDEIKLLAVVVARYLSLLTMVIQNDSLDPALYPQAMSHIEDSQRAFQFAAKEFPPAPEAVPQWATKLKLKDKDGFMLEVFDWLGSGGREGFLSTSGMKVPLKDLQVKPIEAAE